MPRMPWKEEGGGGRGGGGEKNRRFSLAEEHGVVEGKGRAKRATGEEDKRERGGGRNGHGT